MHLTALDIHGFKSFPDKTRLEFGSGITCVVGPNGSGKSNVSDAVRWVLGEQSTRQLRGAKMEDVIFSGTDRRRALGLAEVTLHLDNKDRSLNRDEDDVAVTRRLYRSGESDYLINGKSVRLKDVHELFMDTGLGRDGYSLVGQGRVAELVSSHSAQRRDMLEEAAGISQSRYRREAAQRKLAQAEENLIRLRDILLELEGRVEPLRQQKEKAEKFLTLAERRKKFEIGLALHTIAQSTESLRGQEYKIIRAQEEYRLCEEELARFESEIAGLQAQSQELTLRMEELRLGRAAQEEQALRQEGEILVQENTLEHNKSAMERIARERAHADDDSRQLEEEIASVLAQIEALRREVEQRQEALLACAKQADRHRDEENALLSQSAALSQSLQSITEQLAQRHIEQSAADSSALELKSRIETIEQSGGLRAQQVLEFEQQLLESNQLLNEHRGTVQSLQNSLQGYQLRAKSRASKAEDARRELERLRGEHRQAQSRAKLLEDLEQNMEGYSGAVRALMKESARGGLKGLHGTLSQLIRVEPDYTLAVETALGPALQHIVTDNEGAAKRAIEYLKRGSTGRATFLPLTSIDARDFRETGLESRPGFIAMAQELVTCDSRYDTIVKAQLGRTAVAEDIDSAIAIAKHYGYRFRIVTLDGQVINAGGSITGGSKSQGTGILSRGNEIARLKQEISQLERQVDDQAAKAKQISEEASAAQAASSGTQGDLARAQEDVIRQESHNSAIEARLQDARAAQTELSAELAAAARRVTQLEEARRMGDTRAEELARQKQDLERQQEALRARQAELSKRREQAGREESALRMELLGIEKDVESREELVASLRLRREGHAGRDRELLEEEQALRQSDIEIGQKITQLRESIAALREGAAQGAAEAESLAAQREDLQAHAETLRREERIQLGKKETLGGDLARQEERRALARQALDNAAAKLYDDYQITPREAEAEGYRLEDPTGASIELSEVSAKIRALGNINVDAIEEYREVSERYEFLHAQVEDVERSKEELTRLISDLTEKMSERFRAQFAKINKYFGETFQDLFSGGQAALELENPLDVLESAIEIRVQPPGKNVQNIDLLSGGEKGLSAIALLFAILKANPAPFCIFDEVEAALDDVNVTRYARYVRRMTKNTQFILISHRRGTMEEADVLYGVTMQEGGVSKLLEMKTKEMAGQLGIE